MIRARGVGEWPCEVSAMVLHFSKKGSFTCLRSFAQPASERPITGMNNQHIHRYRALGFKACLL
jgi:hypothetical protein